MKKKKKSGLLPILLMGGVVLISIIGLQLPIMHDRPISKTPQPYPAQDDVVRVTAEEAYQAQQNGAVIVDTRSEDQFAQQHIAGAINVPLDQLENRINELDPSTWYITYCT